MAFLVAGRALDDRVHAAHGRRRSEIGLTHHSPFLHNLNRGNVLRGDLGFPFDPRAMVFYLLHLWLSEMV